MNAESRIHMQGLPANKRRQALAEWLEDMDATITRIEQDIHLDGDDSYDIPPRRVTVDFEIPGKMKLSEKRLREKLEAVVVDIIYSRMTLEGPSRESRIVDVMMKTIKEQCDAGRLSETNSTVGVEEKVSSAINACFAERRNYGLSFSNDLKDYVIRALKNNPDT